MPHCGNETSGLEKKTMRRLTSKTPKLPEPARIIPPFTKLSLAGADLGHVVMLAELGEVGVQLLDTFLVRFQQLRPCRCRLRHLQELFPCISMFSKAGKRVGKETKSFIIVREVGVRTFFLLASSKRLSASVL